VLISKHLFFVDKLRIIDQYFINSRNKPIISAKLIALSAIELK